MTTTEHRRYETALAVATATLGCEQRTHRRWKTALAVATAVLGCEQRPRDSSPSSPPADAAMLAGAVRAERPAYRVCIETPGGAGGSALGSGPFLLRAEAVAGVSSTCSWGAVKCVTGDVANASRVDVDYTLFAVTPERAQDACSLDLAHAPAWCLAAPSAGPSRGIELRTAHGTFVVPIPNKLAKDELCFGPATK